MPCRDYFDEPEKEAELRIKMLQQDINKIRQKSNTFARLLCEAGNIIVENGLKGKMSDELIGWLFEHNAADKKNK